MLKLLAENKKTLFLGLLSAFIYVYIAYLLERSYFYELLACFAICFGIYVWFCKNSNSNNLIFFIGLGVIFRLLFLFSVPALSDDYFRFIWDGQLIAQGLNPFDLKPTEVLIDFPNKATLLAEMNSPDYYTVYPPVAQVVYFLSAKLSPDSILGSVVVMRSIIILAELGIILLLPKLLRLLKLNANHALWYILNPLVIVELSGNLHFEGIMIFFFLLAAYLLILQQSKLSAVAWALAAGTKLIPIFFLPIVLRTIPFKKALVFYLVFGFSFLALWLPLYNSELIPHFLESIQLYSETFEFNASIYYLIRLIGYEMIEYNVIQTAGPWLTRIAYLGILIILLKKKIINWQRFFNLILFALSWYYLLALIVHPWYSITLVFLAVFTNFRYPMLWSFLAVFSYWAYSNPTFQENFWLISLEYLLVTGFAVWELSKSLSLKNKRSLFKQNIHHKKL